VPLAKAWAVVPLRVFGWITSLRAFLVSIPHANKGIQMHLVFVGLG